MKRLLLRALGALLVLAALGAAAFFGLVEHTPLAAHPRARATLPAEVDARLEPDRSFPLAVTLDAEIAVGGHRVLPGRIAVRRAESPAPFETRFQLWLADGAAAAPAPTLVVTPILGGDNEVEEIIADDLASHGMHAVIVDRRLPKEPSFANFERALRDMVATRRRVIDWLETRPEVDARRIGAYGVSLGGLTTTMLAAVEPRIRASIVVMAGGPLGNVLSRSVEGEACELRKAEGLADDPTPDALTAFQKRGRAIVETCPCALAPYADPASILLFTTRRDTSVPSDCQLALRDALGGPETYSLPTGHYSAVIYIKYIEAKAREFLARRFAAISERRSDS
jgi:dienelactone hydrolase